MKIGFVADVHLANHKRFGGPVECSLNERCRFGLGVLDAAGNRTHAMGGRYLVSVGDLFDGVRPEPQLIAAVKRLFGPGIDLIPMLGNHEFVSRGDNDNSLSPLAFSIEKAGWLNILNSRNGLIEDLPVFAVPFFPSESKGRTTQILRNVVGGAGQSKASSGARALAVHLGVSDARTPPWLRNASDSIDVDDLADIARQGGFSFVFAGNWHNHQVWSPGDGAVTVIQIGALVPTGFDNPGLDGYGGLVVWDSETGHYTYEEIPGPRFLSLSATEEPPDLSGSPHTVYISAKAAPAQIAERTRALEAARCLGWPAHAYEVLPDRELVEQGARAAGAGAARAETLGAAVAAYVEKMPLSEGVDRGRVLSLTQDFLGVDR